MIRRNILLYFALCALLPVCWTRAEENWPQWRGPQGNGISHSTNVPTEWGLERNIVWKAPLPSWSGGTPVIWGDHVFVTSPTKPSDSAAQEQETRGVQRRRGGRGGFGFGRRDPGGSDLLLLCISKTDGNVIWRNELDQGNTIHNKGNDSSPSPVTDGKHVWAVTGTGAVAAFDMDGKEIWKRNLQRDYGRFGLNWGYASSPLLYAEKLIIQVLHGNNTDDPSYIVAFEAMTGKELWRQLRPTDAVAESPDAYTTPAVLSHEGKDQIVISGGDYVTGHDPATGRELWRAAGLNPQRQRNYRIIASPVVADGMIYAPTRKTPLLALQLAGSGAVSTTWKWTGRAAPDVPTPVCDGKYFYMVDDAGIATCLDAKTGAVIWGPSRTVPGTVSASPLLVDGKIYIINENAVTTVLAAGPEFNILATNELDGTYTLSSVAVAGELLFIRTSTHLYCIGSQSAG